MSFKSIFFLFFIQVNTIWPYVWFFIVFLCLFFLFDETVSSTTRAPKRISICSFWKKRDDVVALLFPTKLRRPRLRRVAYDDEKLAVLMWKIDFIVGSIIKRHIRLRFSTMMHDRHRKYLFSNLNFYSWLLIFFSTLKKKEKKTRKYREERSHSFYF